MMFWSWFLSSDGLDVRPFMAGSGFTETAFMSSTRDLRVALDYSGARHGRVATVLPPRLRLLSLSSLPSPAVAQLKHVFALAKCFSEACWVFR
jgi:hypothetical protein